MTRYEIILKKHRDQQRMKLERAANDVRKASQKHGIPVKFFGSFAEGLVDRDSDLDVFVCADKIPFDFKWELNEISISHKIGMDVMKECNAPYPDMKTVL